MNITETVKHLKYNSNKDVDKFLSRNKNGLTLILIPETDVGVVSTVIFQIWNIKPTNKQAENGNNSRFNVFCYGEATGAPYAVPTETENAIPKIEGGRSPRFTMRIVNYMFLHQIESDKRCADNIVNNSEELNVM